MALCLFINVFVEVVTECDHNNDNQEYECGNGEGVQHNNLVVPVTEDSSYLIRLGGWQEGRVGTTELFVEFE